MVVCYARWQHHLVHCLEYHFCVIWYTYFKEAAYTISINCVDHPCLHYPQYSMLYHVFPPLPAPLTSGLCVQPAPRIATARTAWCAVCVRTARTVSQPPASVTVVRDGLDRCVTNVSRHVLYLSRIGLSRGNNWSIISCLMLLTRSGDLNKMATYLQTTLLMYFFKKKNCSMLIQINWRSLLSVQLTMSQHWLW